MKKTTKTYSVLEIEAAWRKFKKAFLYRALVNGKWELVESVEHGKRAGATKIDIKRAKDVLDFPDYLFAVMR